MTSAQRELLNCIRSSLWSDPASAEPSAAALEEARAQAILPLVAPDSPGASRHMAHAVRVLHAQDRLGTLLREAGIPMAVLKGAAAAIYYPEPMRRTMGDIDLIVPPDRFGEARALMERSGYRTGPGENAHPAARHIALYKDGLIFELHRRFSHEGLDIEAYIGRGLREAVAAELGGHVFPVLPPLENGLVLLAHLAQHLRNDLGLRQMIDWMMYVHAHLSDAYWETAFRPAAADCGLEKLAVTAARLCQKYLGLPDPITWCGGADEGLTDDLMESLLVTGNFGRVHGSGSDVETVATNIQRIGLFRTLQRQGERNWRAYEKHRVLKPLCWAYQIGRYLHRGLGTGRGGSALASDYRRSRARAALLRRLGLD